MTRRPAKALRARESRPLLERILETPHLAEVVPRLQPEVLHRVIQNCGLQDCSELVSLATPGQLERVFDLDLWRATDPGLDERFDADRFGVWIEVLAEAGVTIAAQKLAAIDIHLVIAGLAQHARIFDAVAYTPYVTLDGVEMTHLNPGNDGLSSEIGGFLLVAKRADSWDAIVDVLIALEAAHPACFRQVMRACCALSNSAPEIDARHDLLGRGDQAMLDLAIGRQHRREEHGYLTPAQARAFLQMSRQVPAGRDTMPPADPIARAYFRSIDRGLASDVNSSDAMRHSAGSETPPASDDSAAAVATVVGMLVEAGIVAPQARALLGGSGDHARLARIRAKMQFVHERDAAAHSTRNEELAYLANAIMAGCSIQARPFTAQEASDAAVATCNLGLENWPAHWLTTSALPDDFLVDHDLVSVFRVGWSVLHRNVGMFAAEQLIEVLAGLRCEDRETQAGLDALRVEMTKHWQVGMPWRAQDALDVIAILDMPAWATLLALTGECPVIHAGLGATQDSRTLTVSATRFEFVSENDQIASVRTFMRTLPATLGVSPAA